MGLNNCFAMQWGGWTIDMKKRIERIFSDKCMRGMAVCLVLTVSIAFLGYVILLSLKTVIPADSFSALADIFVILITILKIIVTLSAVIMGVRLIIYGNEVKHEKYIGKWAWIPRLWKQGTTLTGCL